ncbi:MAG: alpha-galactosidase [Eubacteriales bacterium]|nr:alpha-galactosidase [Eubacteriales bacterium]
MNSIVSPEDLSLRSVLPNFRTPEELPVSFTCSKTAYRGLPASFHPVVQTQTLDSRMRRTVVVGRHRGGLQVRVEITEYQDYPAAEIIAFFSNEGKTPGELVSDFKSLDLLLPLPGARLTRSNGDTLRADGFAQWTEPLEGALSLSPRDGTPCNGAFPYFRLQGEQWGVNVAVGWPAVWQADVIPEKKDVRLRIGQKRCRMRLQPGESMRTPRVSLVAYRGGEERGRNLWRRWYLDHILPRENGRPLPPKCCMHVFGAEGKPEFTGASEENQLRGLQAYLSRGVRPDVWWIDAGWYPCAYEWPRTGTWRVDEARFPRGLAPIGEKCAQEGVQLLLWFEPERVRPDTDLAREHPQWLLHRALPEGGEAENMLLDLGNAQACDHLIELVDGLIKRSGVRVYRQDFNFDPKPYWEQAEGEDRIGAVENRHVQGYLRYWDSLLERNPGLWIDSCASGGRRNDLETMRRAVPLHYTDVGYGNHPVKQLQHRLMFEWIPYFRAHNMNWDDPVTGEYGSSGKPQDRFSYYAALAPALTDMLEWDACEEDFALAREMQPIWRRAAQRMLDCDYYPLSECRASREDYYAMQFHDPAAQSGFVHVLRNNGCAQPLYCLRMRMLEPDAVYLLTNAESGVQLRLSGRDLTGGVDFALPRRSGVLYFYEKQP